MGLRRTDMREYQATMTEAVRAPRKQESTR